MKKRNINKEPNIIKYKNEDTNEIKKLLLILLGIVVIVFLLFFITSKYLLKDGFQNTKPTQVENISYDKVNVGTIFNRPYDEYFVFAFDSTLENASYYNAIISNYTGKIKVYTLDLSIPKNHEYAKETANKNAKNVSELAFAEVNLIHIKDGKIVDYLDNISDIEKKLK